MSAQVRNTIVCIVLGVLVSGCASQPDTSRYCGTVSGYLDPNPAQDLYRAVVTHLNGKPVISKPNYQLSPGIYEFTLAELISAPELKVKLAARTPKVLSVTVDTNLRYHLAAKFNTDKIYRGNNTDFWMPVIWQQEAHDCELPELK
jgi:hypothetical protein